MSPIRAGGSGLEGLRVACYEISFAILHPELCGLVLKGVRVRHITDSDRNPLPEFGDSLIAFAADRMRDSLAKISRHFKPLISSREPGR